MRRLTIAIAIILLVIIAGFTIFVSTFDINKYHGTIQAQLSKRLGREVTLGPMSLSLFPPRLVVHDVKITDDPTVISQRPFVTTQELDVSPKLLPLLHKSIEIDSLYLERPYVELIKERNGQWNFSSLGDQKKTPPEQKAPSNQSSQEQFSLSKLTIKDGQVATTDQAAQTPRSVYDHIDVTLRDFAPNRPFSLDAALRLPGPGNQAISLQGSGGPIRRDQPAATPFHGTLNLQQVAIASARPFVNSPMLAKANGSISGQTKISSESGKLSANGQMNIQNVRLNGQDLGYPITARYKVNDDVANDLLTIDSSRVNLGATPLQVSGTVDSKNKPARLNLCLKANGASVAEAARLAALSGTALTPGATVSGIIDANIEARGSANKPALNGTVNGRDLQVSGKDFPYPVQVQNVALNLTPNEVRSNQFAVKSGTTSMNVQFALQGYVSPNPTVNATVQAGNAQLPGLLAIAKAYGVAALDKVSGAGTINVDLHATGPLKSISSSDIARDLNGNVGLNAQDVHYSGADISHELTGIAGVLGLHQGNQGSTTINKLTGNIGVKNGIAQTNDLQALLDIGNLGITGTANLVDQSLNLRAVAVMGKELSQKAGGTNVGGYAKTALANSDGELVIPAKVTGTFEHPQFAPDVQQIAQMKLKGLVPGFDNPAGGVSSILGNVLNQQGGNGAKPQQPSQNQQQQNPLQQLKGIFGKKPQ